MPIIIATPKPLSSSRAAPLSDPWYEVRWTLSMADGTALLTDTVLPVVEGVRAASLKGLITATDTIFVRLSAGDGPVIWSGDADEVTGRIRPAHR